MMNLFKIIWNFIKKLFNFLHNNGDTLAKGAGVAGGVAAVAGLEAGIRADSVNKKALAIREESLAMFHKSTTKTEGIMKNLGDLQIEIVSTFDSFVEAMEKIQRRPKGLKNKLAKVSLPDYDPEKLKILSNDLQLVLVGAGGAVAGMGIGVAAFGINALALGPGALVGGVVLCVKGLNLSKKATQNIRQARQLKKDVEKICDYHTQLQRSAEVLYQSLSDVKPQYFSHLKVLKELVSRKTDYNDYSKEERLLVRNSILLVSLMYDMCKVTLVRKAENENSLETVNEKEVKSVVDSAKLSFSKVDPIPQTLYA